MNRRQTRKQMKKQMARFKEEFEESKRLASLTNHYRDLAHKTVEEYRGRLESRVDIYREPKDQRIVNVRIDVTSVWDAKCREDICKLTVEKIMREAGWR